MARTIRINRQGECFDLVAKNTGGQFYQVTKGGRSITYKVCIVGPPPAANLHISRGGRRGGARSEGKVRAGLTVCQARGDRSSCLRAKDFIVFPGGGAALRRKGINVMGKHRRRRP